MPDTPPTSAATAPVDGVMHVHYVGWRCSKCDAPSDEPPSFAVPCTRCGGDWLTCLCPKGQADATA